ncbi:MAG TPA: hypothetical protein VFI02_03965, partial [Armatimonadota bacterium]|nr:hypothetical protein [Armatimonadota bacterium]
EGGVFFRLFEGAIGSGLGVKVDLSVDRPPGREDGILFGEAVGAMLLEVHESVQPSSLFRGLPWFQIGRVTNSPGITILDNNKRIFKARTDDLVKVWERPFAEVVR